MEKIAVYGAGAIASGEAMLIIGNGMPCTVIGHSYEGMERCLKVIGRYWDDLIEAGLAEEKNKAAALDLLTISGDPSSLKGSTYVFEAIAEDKDKKGEVYQLIERYADPDVITASCTSSLDASELAALTSRPENFILVHPLNPPYMIPFVEIVVQEKTSNETLNRSLEVVRSLHRKPVMLKKPVTGFIVNRLQQAVYREAINLIESGVTTADDIDLVIKYLGQRYASVGFTQMYDDVGLPLEASIARNVYPDLCKARDTQPLIQELLDKGCTGRASGKGLHDWSAINDDDYRYRKTSPFFYTVREWQMPG